MPPALGTVARASHSRLLQPCQAARSVAVSTQSHRLQRICDQDSKVRLLVTGGLGFPEAYMRCTSTDISTYYLLQAGMSICVYTQFRRYATHLRVYPDANTNPGTSSSATSSFEARASPASSPVGQGNFVQGLLRLEQDVRLCCLRHQSTHHRGGDGLQATLLPLVWHIWVLHIASRCRFGVEGCGVHATTG